MFIYTPKLTQTLSGTFFFSPFHPECIFRSHQQANATSQLQLPAQSTHHPCGGRWSPPCAPRSPAAPVPPGQPSGGWWTGRAGSRTCTASAWRPAWRSPSSRRSRRCSRWSRSSAHGHWLWWTSYLEHNGGREGVRLSKGWINFPQQ